MAQQRITVLDHEGASLPAAHVTVSSIDGKKKLTVLAGNSGETLIPKDFLPAQEKAIVSVSYLGFTTFTDTIVLEQRPLEFRLKPDRFALDQVVVTAQYAPTSAEKSVHNIRIIDRKRIEQQAAVNLRDVLQKETNMRVTQDNILGSGLSVQGISGQNVKFLVDGVPVIGRLDGNIDLSQLNMNNVERIEVVEGPLSVNFGTDALAGTINIITRKPESDQIQAELNSYYESVGQYNLDGRLSFNTGAHGFTLTGGRNYFDGWSPSDAFFTFPEKTVANASRSKEWNPKEQFFVSVQYQYKHKSWTFRPNAEWFQEEIVNRGLPRAPYEVTAFDDRYLTERISGGLDASGKVHPDYRLAVVAAYNYFQRTKNTYFRDLTTLSEELTANDGDQDTSRFDLMMSRGSISRVRPNAKINFELGYDVNVETASGPRIDNGSQTIGDYAAFGSMEYKPVDGLVLRPGVRYSYNTQYRAPVTPSFNIKYNVSDFTIRGSYARGFRAPTIKELYFNFVDINHNIQGSNDLQAEHSDNVTINFKWKHLKEQTSVKVELNAYYNDIRNMITLGLAEGSATEFTYINIGNFRTVGTQLNTAVTFHHFTGDVGFAYVGRYNQLPAEIEAPHFSFTPEFRSVLTYDFKKINASIALFYNYVGVLPSYTSTAEGEVTLREVADYHLLDITVSKKFWKDRIVWSVGAKNLLNVQQVESGGGGGGVHSSGAGTVPVAWGRSVFTSLAFRFSHMVKKKEK